jgi:hypothetical protein
MAVTGPDPEAQNLVEDLRETLDLDEIDAKRAVFTILAYGRAGWPKAKIARHLGISNVRVGQRIAKYQRYAEDGIINEPTLMNGSRPQAPIDVRFSNRRPDASEYYTLRDWEDEGVAWKLINMVMDHPA